VNKNNNKTQFEGKTSMHLWAESCPPFPDVATFLLHRLYFQTCCT